VAVEVVVAAAAEVSWDGIGVMQLMLQLTASWGKRVCTVRQHIT
jgi:hypothetical protein